VISGATAVNTRVQFLLPQRTRGCGCTGHPAFPRALFGAEGSQHNSGAIRAARSRICVCVIAARYRTSLNIGSSVLAGSRLASFTSSAGLVVIQTTHAMASSAAAAITVSALLVNSGGSMACASC
jgi:hypothetical protein